MMFHTNFTVLLWTAVIATYCAAHDDVTHYHSNEEGIHDHGHHHDHFQSGSAQSKIRSRTLVNNFFAASEPTTGKARCKTEDPTPEMIAESSRIVEKWRASSDSRQSTTINVSTYFHMVTADENLDTGETETVGYITDEDVTNQIQALNDSFSPYGFTFTLVGTTRTNNTEWYYFDDVEMKSALRVGDSSTLNVYFTNALGYLGYATFPSWYEDTPDQDGVVVVPSSIPGGEPPYDEGLTLVHEVGHWLGLYHTFQPDLSGNNRFFQRFLFGNFGICSNNNDEVDDTPKQASPTYGCPTGRDSCALFRGLDPIQNYMDYSDDVCYTEFTESQMVRMQALWNEYRAV